MVGIKNVYIFELQHLDFGARLEFLTKTVIFEKALRRFFLEKKTNKRIENRIYLRFFCFCSKECYILLIERGTIRVLKDEIQIKNNNALSLPLESCPGLKSP